MLHKEFLENCYNQYNSIKGKLPPSYYLGYMEACLVQFGVIESKGNGVKDYALKTKKKFLFWEYEVEEHRAQVIVRLTKQYLGK
jgi:hypothetical protein